MREIIFKRSVCHGIGLTSALTIGRGESGISNLFSAKQMIQANVINLKDAGSTLKRKHKKLLVGIWVIGLMLAAFFYWRYLQHLTGRVPTKASHIASAVAVPATAKSESAASLPKPDVKATQTKTDDQAFTGVATFGLADSLASFFSPSAKAETIQPEMQSARNPATETAKPAKPVTLQPAASVSAGHGLEPQAMTVEQTRLKIAQDGFADVMNLANKYPDSYGFKPGEDLSAAQLGDPLPVHLLSQPGRMTYKGQPVESLFKPAEEWLFPIILKNQIRFMVQVRYVGHDYVLGPGSRALALTYEKILSRWPTSEGFHPQLVIMSNQTGYYFTIPEMPGQNLTDTSRMFDFNPTLSPADIMLASWR
jgi:hypothetical protein